MPLHFYSFERVIGRALEEMGYEVTTANDEYPKNPLGRILGKLDLPISRWWTRRVFRNRILGGQLDLVVIVKGRGVGPKLVADMKRHAKRVVGYHFDALSYDRACERWGASVDRVSTFDFRDAREKNWQLVELFSAQTPIVPPPPIRYRISAIQRNHSDRLAYLDTVMTALGDEDSFVFLYEQHILSLAMNAFKNPRLYWKWRKRISFKPLSYAQYVEALSGSEFTLDYAHPGQTGSTMRSFEALAMGVKLITNNVHTVESPYFDERNCIGHELGGDPAELRAKVEARRGYRPEPFQRSPTMFLSEVIGPAETA